MFSGSKTAKTMVFVEQEDEEKNTSQEHSKCSNTHQLTTQTKQKKRKKERRFSVDAHLLVEFKSKSFDFSIENNPERNAACELFCGKNEPELIASFNGSAFVQCTMYILRYIKEKKSSNAKYKTKGMFSKETEYHCNHISNIQNEDRIHSGRIGK